MSKITRPGDTLLTPSVTPSDAPQTTQAAKAAQNPVDSIEQTSDPTSAQGWSFDNAYPVKWEGPDFDASGNDVAIESLEITHQGFEVGDSTLPGRIEYPNITIYIPEQEDTLQSVALKFGVSEEAIAKANNLDPADPLPERIQLKIPGWK